MAQYFLTGFWGIFLLFLCAHTRAVEGGVWAAQHCAEPHYYLSTSSLHRGLCVYLGCSIIEPLSYYTHLFEGARAGTRTLGRRPYLRNATAPALAARLQQGPAAASGNVMSMKCVGGGTYTLLHEKTYTQKRKGGGGRVQASRSGSSSNKHKRQKTCRVTVSKCRRRR